jgi:hypothetical protein
VSTEAFTSEERRKVSTALGFKSVKKPEGITEGQWRWVSHLTLGLKELKGDDEVYTLSSSGVALETPGGFYDTMLWWLKRLFKKGTEVINIVFLILLLTTIVFIVVVVVVVVVVLCFLRRYQDSGALSWSRYWASSPRPWANRGGGSST